MTIIVCIETCPCMFKAAAWPIVIVKNKIDDILNPERNQHALNILIIESFDKLYVSLELFFV